MAPIDVGPNKTMINDIGCFEERTCQLVLNQRKGVTARHCVELFIYHVS